MVDKWIKNHQLRPKEAALILTKTNAKVAKLNEKIRDELKLSGEIRGEDIQLRATTSSSKVTRLLLAAGDQVRFTKRNDDLAVINGTTAKILRIVTGKQDETRLTLQLGDKIKSVSLSDLADDRGRVPLTHNYVSTIYSAQGMTVDRTYVLADSSLKRNEIYVAASRAKLSTELVIDESDVVMKVRQKQLLSERGTKDVERDAIYKEIVAGWHAPQNKVSALNYTQLNAKYARERKSFRSKVRVSGRLLDGEPQMKERSELEL